MTRETPDQLGRQVDPDLVAVNTIRTLAIDAVQKANSGHPGMPLGAAPMAHVLWTRHMRFDPDDPTWPNRDRFVLSAGHGSALLYGILHMAGFDVSIEDLEQFRQWGSRTPGHPEFGHTAGVETSTGPLGAGFSNAVGMAMAEAFLAATFNRPEFALVGHRTFAIVGDGDLMEGVSSEAASLAGHLQLGRLVLLYDDNQISIEGCTDQTFTEDVGRRFEAMGWHVLEVPDGNDLESIHDAITQACAVEDKPSLIKVRTTIGYGSPGKAGTADCHGSPLGVEECRLTKEALGWPADSHFEVPKAARLPYAGAIRWGKRMHGSWQALWESYQLAFPELADQWTQAIAGELPKGWQDLLPRFSPDDGPIATRSASGKVLNALAQLVPTLVGGSADLAPSNNTYLTGAGDFQPDNYAGRNLRFGVREHAMGGILNGLAYHGGVFAYGATFFVFSDYMRAPMRIAALAGLPVVYVFTHDSIGVGEDGPTHQPIEHLASLRAMPGLRVIRPSDATETTIAWQVALERRDQPTALVLSRQALPVLDRSVLGSEEGLRRGGYVLRDSDASDGPDVILLATGSEVRLALSAHESLSSEGFAVRVVALPCWELFEEQPAEYRETVLPSAVLARVSIEAASTFGWSAFVGTTGKCIGIDRFGASAPANRLYAEFGITAEHVAEAARMLLRGGR